MPLSDVLRLPRAVAAGARWLLLALVAALTLSGAGPAVASTEDPDPAGVPGPVVLVGVTGVRWDDVHTLATPALWELSRRASVAAVAARSVEASACPADGWLAVSAAARLADPETPDGTCRTLREAGPGTPVPGWADFVAAAQDQPYAATPGLLGERLAEEGVAVTGIGPGAAVALADRDGVPVGTTVRRPATPAELRRAVRAAVEASRLVVVDAGTVRDPGRATAGRPADGPDAAPGEPEQPGLPPGAGEERPQGVDVIVEPTRAEQVRLVDERIGAVLAAVGEDATVLVVSLADSGRAALQLAMAVGPAPAGPGGPYGESLLTSGSTRQPALVQTTDVNPTLLDALALPETGDGSAGAPMVAADGPASATARVALVLDVAAEARQVIRVSGAYLTRLVLSEAVLFVVAALLLTRGGPQPSPRLTRGLVALRVAALALASAPIASFLAGALPWWRAGSPTAAFWVAVLAWMAAITALAVLGPWRRLPLGPAGVVAGITVVVLLADAVAGSPLVVDSPMGAHRIQAARFYGMSNQAFALLAAAGPLLAIALAHPLVSRGRRRAATLVVIAIGLVLTVVDGAPGLGSDFGGPPALILAFAVLALVVSGRRVRWRTLLVVAVVAAAVVLGFAGLDWLRPPADRTHLGRFFATVLDGGLLDVLQRKIEVHLRVLTLWRYLVLAIGGGLLTALVLLGPLPWRLPRAMGGLGRARPGTADAPTTEAGRSPLAGLGADVPLVPTGVAAIGIALGIGFLINDSGIVVPATGFAVAVPCLIAAAAQRRLALADAAADGVPGQRPH